MSADSAPTLEPTSDEAVAATAATAADDVFYSGHRSERKQSSGDLHSRLKTRKLLGVGGTDDGDVHRSKLSQILGHSDQLYQQPMPWGVKECQLVCALGVTCYAALTLARPYAPFLAIEPQQQQQQQQQKEDFMMSGGGSCEFERSSLLALSRLYGGCMLVFACALWLCWRSEDRWVARMSLAGTTCLLVIHIIVQSAGHQVGWLCQAGLTACALLTASMCGRLCQTLIQRGTAW